MSFLFASSHLPETGAQHPEEEEEEMVDPHSLPRAGMVRAFSHLPQAVRRVVKAPAETPPRGAEAEHDPDSGFGGTAPREWGAPTRDAGFDEVRPEELGPGTRDAGFDLPPGGEAAPGSS